MLNVYELNAQDLHGLSPSSLAEVAAQMLHRIGEQSKQIAAQAQAIKFRDVKIERITFELARLRAWKFAAKTERMNAEQRQLFEETLAADEASLEAQLEALQAQAGAPLDAAPVEARQRPKRQALPEHLPRIEHQHEPKDTTCPTPQCGQPMVRVGEDVSERLDIVPAQFFVHRHIRGKWACRCCELLRAAGAGTRRAADHRQRHARRRPGGAPWSAASLTTCRTTARSRSTPARAYTRRALRWRPGRVGVVLRCSRCSMRTRPSCSARRCCTPTRRR